MLSVVLLAAIIAFVVGGSEFVRRVRGAHAGTLEYPLFVSVVSAITVVVAVVRIADNW